MWDPQPLEALFCPSAGESNFYRADVMRTEKVDGATTKYFYDGQMPIEEDYNPSGTITKVTRNTLGGRGIDMISTTTSSSTEDRYPLYDGHGNMIATLGKNGSGGCTIDDLRTYDVWGSVRSGAASGGPTKRYSANLGHQADDESDLLYMRARYYEPASGRFICEDPAKDGSNWLAYAANNPVTYIDYDGKKVGSAGLTWLTALLNMAGSFIGFYSAFFVTVELLQIWHPSFQPSADWLAGLLGAFGTTATVIFTAKMNFGGGMTIARYMMKYGWRALGIGFGIGVLMGAYSAKVAWELYYSEHFDD